MYKYKMKAVDFLKIFDKFLKLIKTDRNTFFTYILTLITVYILVDRIVEMLLMIFTGMAVSYWGPIKYAFAILCPLFAFLFSCPSKFDTDDKMKLAFFDLTCISLYIIIVSMITQWLNEGLWMLFISVPNYSYIVGNFSFLIKPAFSSIALFLPLATFYPLLLKWLITTVHDTKDIVDSIGDYAGISLSDKSIGEGPYTCEVYLCRDSETGKKIKLTEDRRYLQTLVVGVSGAGKTSLIFEPLIARDLDKKFFFSQIAKEMGFTALKSGLASLDGPYDNEYLNKNFTLNMLKPSENKLDVFNSYMNKMIISKSNEEYVYKDLGITYACPDYESMAKMMKVADSYGLTYNVVDPNNSDSIGLNPFVYTDPLQTSIAISTVLKGLYATDRPDNVLAYRENAASQAIENISILLKEMYPKLNDGDLPTLEDVQDLLTDFDLVEAMCNKMAEDEELSKQYSALLRYFKKNFYKDSAGRKDMEVFVTAVTAQLDKLLRFPGVKNILCNRTNNINYDKALANGEITFLCTRRGDLGPTIHTAFGLFFILLMQYSVLKRPGTERTRVPHFLYIDEVSSFINPSIEPIFTLYRKYRVGAVLSVQNLAQLGDKLRQTILSNCNNKVVFGNNTPEDNEWWSKEMGDKRDWDFSNTYNADKVEYDPKKGNIGFRYKPRYMPGKVQALKFKQCMYKVRGTKGRYEAGKGLLDFLPASFSNPKKIKQYDFSKFINDGIGNSNNTKDTKDFNVKNLNKKPDYFKDDISNEINPIQTKPSSFLFDNEDAIVINLKKKKGENSNNTDNTNNE